jgi:hypothetical protein
MKQDTCPDCGVPLGRKHKEWCDVRVMSSSPSMVTLSQTAPISPPRLVRWHRGRLSRLVFSATVVNAPFR